MQNVGKVFLFQVRYLNNFFLPTGDNLREYRMCITTCDMCLTFFSLLNF